MNKCILRSSTDVVADTLGRIDTPMPADGAIAFLRALTAADGTPDHSILMPLRVYPPNSMIPDDKALRVVTRTLSDEIADAPKSYYRYDDSLGLRIAVLRASNGIARATGRRPASHAAVVSDGILVWDNGTTVHLSSSDDPSEVVWAHPEMDGVDVVDGPAISTPNGILCNAGASVYFHLLRCDPASIPGDALAYLREDTTVKLVS